MGWGVLGKVLGTIGGVAAAPFTGGASLIPTILGGAGAAIGGMGQAAASNRGAAEDAQLQRDLLRQRGLADYETALEDRAKLDLDRRKFAQDSQSDAYVKALRSALALNFQPMARPSGVPNISFIGKGIGDQGRAAAEALNRDVLIRLMEGEKFDDLPALERFTPTAAPKASIWEKLAGILGPSLSVAGAAAPGLMKKKTNYGSAGYD